MPKKSKLCTICFAKHVKNDAILGELFWPEFYAHRRVMKYSMSGSGSIFGNLSGSSPNLKIFEVN